MKKKIWVVVHRGTGGVCTSQTSPPVCEAGEGHRPERTPQPCCWHTENCWVEAEIEVPRLLPKKTLEERVAVLEDLAISNETRRIDKR